MKNRNLIYGITAVVLLLVAGVGVYTLLDMQKDAPKPESSEQTDTEQNNETNTDGTELEEEEVNATSHKSEKGVDVTVDTPARASKVASPLEVKGTVPGNWSNEGQFVVRLLDANGTVLAESNATLDGDWMTETQVPFSATLDFTAPEADTAGLLVLEKANPSGEPDSEDTLSIFILF